MGKEKTITLYRPVGPREYDLLVQSKLKKWPPRLPEQPIFYPVTNEKYAQEITAQWNLPQHGVGYVTKFAVREQFMERNEIHKVGARHHTEWWIPAEDLEEMNANIVGTIEIISEFRKRKNNI